MTARIAVVTIASAARSAHVARQQHFLDLQRSDREPLIRVIGWLDADPITIDTDAIVVHVPPGSQGLRVAEGRNRAARAAIAAGADLLVFLDADCLPGPYTLSAYADATAKHPDSLLCGAVTYLSEGERPESFEAMTALTRPHAARPAPERGSIDLAEGDAYDLFWSLSFAVTAATWQSIGEFSPVFEGYGAEDTDFAWRARARNVPMRWVGGADAYHQWHETSSPPWQHLDDILRNGAAFADTWGRWPMTGWIEAFAAADAIRWDGARWQRVGTSGRRGSEEIADSEDDRGGSIL